MSQSKISPARVLRPRLLTHAIVLSMATSTPGLALAQSSYVDPGKSGREESWRTDEFKKNWGLAAVGADYAYARGLSGEGVRVGILDDGTAAWHSELAGKTHNLINHDPGCSSRTYFAGPNGCYYGDGGVGYEYTSPLKPEQLAFFEQQVKDGKVPQAKLDELLAFVGYKQTIHGTHVAGIIGANRDGSGMQGVAYGVDLYTATSSSDKVKNIEAILGWPGAQLFGRGPSEETRAATQTQFAEHQVRVINNSWGWGDVSKTADELDKAAANIKTLTDGYAAWTRKNKILQVWSAGNNAGSLAHALASLPRYQQDAEPYWVAVANLTSENKLAPSSNQCGLAKDWCVSAPGSDITSSVPSGKIEGEVLRDKDGNPVGMKITKAEEVSTYSTQTGTSMAAPHVTGGLALLMERYPYLTSAQVRDVLLTTAKDLGAPGVDEIYGWGLMDLKKAIDGPGQMRVDTEVKMDHRAGGTKVWQGDAWDDWRNDIGGSGKLGKSGEGWLRLSGNNTFGGVSLQEGVLELNGRNALSAPVQVGGGHLLLNGQLVGSNLDLRGGTVTVQGKVEHAVTTVGKQARLQGGGALADTRVAGTIAPGVAGVGTLTVNGSYTQLAGSVYELDLATQGKSDLIDVRAHADLQGGKISATGATLGESYRILSAQSVSGNFAGAQTASSQPFLSLTLKHMPQQVNLMVGRGQSLASAALTSNQLGVAQAADAASDHDTLLQRLTQLSAPQALAAFQSLSAETHASQRAVLVEQGHALNLATAERLRGLQSQFAQQAEAEHRNGVWARVQSGGGHLDGDGNAARVRYQDSGLTVGYDRELGADWVLGALAFTGKGDMKVSERGARNEDKTRALGVYAGKSWGAWQLRGGWTMAEHHVQSERQVAYGKYNERNRARYTSQGQQGFVELGYQWQAGEHIGLEPYVQWSHVQAKNPRIQEQGGLTALSVQAGRSQVGFATAGLRFAVDMAQDGGQDWLQLGGGLAYRNATGDLSSMATASWQGGSEFTSWSAPVAKQATLLNLNVGARLSRNTLLELGYDGQFASGAHDHAVNARFSLKF